MRQLHFAMKFINKSHEGLRSDTVGMLLLVALCQVDAHRLKLVLELSGISAAELHGNLNQVRSCEV
jgi:hypothetical protein